MKDYDARHADLSAAFVELAPRLLTGNVQVLKVYSNATFYRVRLDGAALIVALEVEVHAGELWAHLSVSVYGNQRKPPNWKQFKWCKERFLGDRKAIQVLPPKAEYVNIHPGVLHLYAPLERDPLPDFRGVDSKGVLAI